jgi:hypothetical protein
MGDHLRIRLGAEHHPFCLQLFPERAVVLDDSVLYNRHPPGSVELRVGVAFLWLALGGPTGVTDAAHEVLSAVSAITNRT